MFRLLFSFCATKIVKIFYLRKKNSIESYMLHSYVTFYTHPPLYMLSFNNNIYI